MTLNFYYYILFYFSKNSSFITITSRLEPEIVKDYKESLRCAIVDFILQDPSERKRLLIETIPVEYPVLILKAPVPWHQAKVIAEHFIEHNLFIGNEILREIRDLWHQKYIFNYC